MEQDCFASVAFPYIPFRSGSYGLGIFTEQGDTIAVKNDFTSPLVPPEKAGFTIGIAATYSGKQQSLLFKTGCNDTVFRISDHKIMPACVLNLQNSDQEIIRCLDATDFSSLHQNLEEIRIFLCLIFLRRHEVIISVAGMMEDIMWFPLIKKQGRFWRSNVSSLKIFLNFLMPIFFWYVGDTELS